MQCKSYFILLFLPNLTNTQHWHVNSRNFLANQYIHLKNGTQKLQKTNQYILLTNVSIKRYIRPGSEPGSSVGGRVPARQVPYRQ